MNESPIFYIIMRNDMDSLNPGKSCTQASHATSEFETTIAYLKKHKELSNIVVMYHEWLENRNFGTTIVLESPWEEIENIFEELKRYDTNDFIGAVNDTYNYGLVFDPTYPVKDGEVTHLIPLHTCGWIFGYRKDLEKFVGHLPLMR